MLVQQMKVFTSFLCPLLLLFDHFLDQFATWYSTGQTETRSQSVSNTLLQLEHNQSVRDNLNELKKVQKFVIFADTNIHIQIIGR